VSDHCSIFLVAGDPAEHRLPEETTQLVPHILAATIVEQLGDRDLRKPDRDLRKPEGIVEFPVGEQTSVRGNARSVEFELDPAVEAGSQRSLSGFTRRVRHEFTLPGTSTVWIHYRIKAKVSRSAQLIR
jgi:hypothetical protein